MRTDKWTKELEKFCRTWARKWVGRNTFNDPEEVEQLMVLRAWHIVTDGRYIDGDPGGINYIIKAMVNTALTEAKKDKQHRTTEVHYSRTEQTSWQGEKVYSDHDDEFLHNLPGVQGSTMEEDVEYADAVGAIAELRNILWRAEAEDARNLARFEAGEISREEMHLRVTPKIRDGVEMLIYTAKGYTREEIKEIFNIPNASRNHIYRLIKESRRVLKIDQHMKNYFFGLSDEL